MASRPGSTRSGFTPLERRRLPSAVNPVRNSISNGVKAEVADGSVLLPAAGREASVLTGFTLTEVLVVIAILVALGSLGVMASFSFTASYGLSAERDTLVGLLERARGQSLANVNQARHGVAVQPSAYVLFQGVSYATRDASLDEPITTSVAITRRGLSEISFDQISGDATGAGTVVLDDGTRTVAVTINHEGAIDW